MKRKAKIILSAIVVFIIPLILSVFLHKGTTNGDWLQFWGAYLGIVVSVAMATFLFVNENKNNLIIEQNNRVTNLYLNDLRDISSEISVFDFASEYWKHLENKKTYPKKMLKI